MSYTKFKEEHSKSDFAPFLKAKHCAANPITLNLNEVTTQKLPKTGDSLVARFAIDARAHKQLKPDYLKQLEDKKAPDIGFPLNVTNGDALAEIFGDNTKNWKGQVQMMLTPEKNPTTGQMTHVLRVVAPVKAK